MPHHSDQEPNSQNSVEKEQKHSQVAGQEQSNPLPEKVQIVPNLQAEIQAYIAKDPKNDADHHALGMLYCALMEAHLNLKNIEQAHEAYQNGGNWR